MYSKYKILLKDYDCDEYGHIFIIGTNTCVGCGRVFETRDKVNDGACILDCGANAYPCNLDRITKDGDA